ncbi:three-helix bundle dimerization domain-containing protein [Mycolicibacterium sp. Dal123E01]|uniref:three-helix bundle dimerization domain-containing protein n=1 Tax=Mycolicibacterium sp. Dal123E01 TaxID=3457578 RepID=UPI00403E808E
MSGVERAEERRQIDQVVDRLTELFPYVPDHVISDTVVSAHQRFDGARIREFVPLFVERYCRALFILQPAVEISV